MKIGIRRCTKAIRHCLIAITLILPLLSGSLSRPARAQENLSPSPAAHVPAVTEWLKTNAIPIKGVQAGSGFDDLQPLKQVLKDVRIVGLGGATQGTREFFQFKHRMLEFLVKEMGFTTFVIEDSYPACLYLNDYIVYGRGPGADTLSMLASFQWRTTEAVQLIEWLREFNKTLPEARRVRFFGADIWDHRQAYYRVYYYLKNMGQDHLHAIGLSRLSRVIDGNVSRMSDAEKEQFRARIQGLIEYLAMNKERLSNASSPREYEDALHCARVLDQFVDTFAGVKDEESRRTTREFYMAKNVEYLMNSAGPHTKIVFWGHNNYVSLQAMGRHLRQTYGSAYYALGFSFNRGGFQAMNRDYRDPKYTGLVEFSMEPARERTMEWFLARPGIGAYLIDFRATQKPPQVTQWLATSLPMRWIGVSYDKRETEQFLQPTALQDNYDGILFIDNTTGTRTHATWAKNSLMR